MWVSRRRRRRVGGWSGPEEGVAQAVPLFMGGTMMGAGAATLAK